LICEFKTTVVVDNRFFRNPNDLLDTLSSTSQYVGSRITTFNYSTLYTTIPHSQLKSRLKELIQCVSQTGTENKNITILFVRHKHAEAKQPVDEHHSYLLKYQSFIDTSTKLDK
jgi:hypothetical protein